MPGSCSACGATDLALRWRVAGAPDAKGLIPSTDAYGVALADIVRCRACGHMQLEPMPSAAVLDGAYADAASEDYIAEEPGQRATARRLLERIEAAARPGRLLDLGCWTGYLLDEARARGWETLGVEPSSFAAAHARDALGLEVIEASLEEAQLAGERFDAVVMADVLEHLPDPASALAVVRERLRPGGVLCLVLPDAGSRVARLMGRRWWSVLPTHVQYFSRESLAVLLRRSGFAVERVGTAPKAFSVDYYLGRLAGYSPALSRGLRALAGPAAGRIVAPDFRDRVLIIARSAG